VAVATYWHKSSSEIQKIIAVSRFQFFIALTISTISSKFAFLEQQPWVLLHTQHTHYNIPRWTILSSVANVEALIPTILHLKHNVTLNILKDYCITVIGGFICLQTWHILDGQIHHINTEKVSDLLCYYHSISDEVGKFNLIFLMTRHNVPPWRSPVLTLKSGCDMDLLGLGYCIQMCSNIKQWAVSNLWNEASASDYMQMAF